MNEIEGSMPAERGKDEARKELEQHLRTLRSDFEDIIQNYSMNVAAQIEDMIRMVKRENTQESEKVLKLKDIEKIVANIRTMKRKPNKGRLKDIKRIQAFLDDIGFILSTYE